MSFDEVRAIAEHAPDFIMLLDRAGTIRFINKAVPPWTRADVVGRSWLDFAQPFERERIAAILEDVFATGHPVELEQVGYGVGGTACWYGSHLGPVRKDGEITGAVLIARDITAQREREARLRVADRLATVGTLAAGVAHGVNNPLSAVVANISIAQRALAALGDHPAAAQLGAALRDAGEAALRIGDVIGDLTVFVRAEDEHLRPVDVRAVLESTLRLTWNELRHRARLVRDLAEVPRVAGNEGRLGQVFLNLIVNAIQAIPDGRADRNVIHVATSLTEDGEVAVLVSDTGEGMTGDVLARLFQPFFTTRSAESAGLGLAISQRIVTALGGRIEVTSAPGAGSTFAVILPALHEERPAPPPPSRVERAPRRARILVIDDEEIVTRVCARVLEEHHEVVTVNAAGAAIDRIVAGERFDAILCDLMMPDLTGMDVHDAIAAAAPELLPRIVFMTGGAFTERARAFIDRVPNPILAKPFAIDDLVDLIARQLDDA